MPVAYVTMKISPLAYQAINRVKKEMKADATREVTYSEVIEKLAALFSEKVSGT